MFYRLIEANLQQLKAKQKSIVKLFPDFFSNPIKVLGIISKGGLRMVSMSKDTWNFKVHSGSEDGEWYIVNLRWKNIVPEIQRAVADRRNWNKTKSKVDLKKVAAQVFSKADVELNCECPAFLYYGKAYILSKDKYRAKYGEQENRPPVVRNPKEYGSYCKHIEALMKTLSFYKGTMANWIKKNYGNVIAKEEEKAAKRAGKYAVIGKALGKRKAKESILNEAGKISPFGTEEEEVQAVLDGKKTIVLLYQVSKETKKANENPDLRSYVFDHHIIFFRKDKEKEGISRSKEVEKIIRDTNINNYATREQMIRLGQLFDYSDEDIDVFLKRVGYGGLLKEDVSKISDPKLRKVFAEEKIEDLQNRISILNKLAKGMQKSLQLSMINSKIGAYEKEIANLKKSLGESKKLNICKQE